MTSFLITHIMPSTSITVLYRLTHTHTYTHPFNGPFSGTTRVSRYQNGKTNLDFTEVRDSEWQWHQLGQVCTLLQTDNHASTPPLSFYWPDALPATQPTASKHWRQQNYWHNQLIICNHQLSHQQQQHPVNSNAAHHFTAVNHIIVNALRDAKCFF